MRIAVYAPVLLEQQISNIEQLVVRTLLYYFYNYTEETFILLNKEGNNYSGLTNLVLFNIKEQPKGSIAKRIWWDVKISRALKKIKPDLFISFDGQCSLTTSIPQSLMIIDAQRIKARSLVKARSILVGNEPTRKMLVENYGLDNEKIFVVQPSPDAEFQAIDADVKGKIKDLYSGSKEFFLYHHSGKGKDLIEVLKAFSLFKKRLGSNLKLLVMTEPGQHVDHGLSNYKYRDDVPLISPEEKKIRAAITASAYAVIIPFNTPCDVLVGLNAMQAGAPVITVKDSDLHEIAGESLLASKTNAAGDISEKMIQMYIDENLRSAFIEKGKLIALNFSVEKTAKQMWQAFMKAFI